MKRLLTGVISVTLIASCCTPEVIYKPLPVTVLEQPKLPVITPEQDQAIPEDVYRTLVTRELLLKKHIKDQKEIIEIHNEASNVKGQ